MKISFINASVSAPAAQEAKAIRVSKNNAARDFAEVIGEGFAQNLVHDCLSKSGEASAAACAEHNRAVSVGSSLTFRPKALQRGTKHAH